MSLYDIDGNEIQIGGSTGGSSQSELQRKFKDKNIIWLGDSIHAYATPDGVTVPYLFQYDSGAKCYNWAQGGMTMALMNNPSYDAYSGVGMIDALVSGDFTDQETYASDDHGTAQGNFLEQVAEMKAFDMSKAHTFIIEFGTNDNWKLVGLDNETDLYDITTTGGALRYMIKSLLTAYPKLNIAVCNIQGGINGTKNEGLELVYTSEQRNEIIENVCDELNIPLIDIYNGLGENDYTKDTLFYGKPHLSHQGKLKQVKLIENRLVQLF